MHDRGQRSRGTRLQYRLTRDLQREAGRLNISQNRLAELCHISSGHMSQIANGLRHPGPEVRRRLLGVFKSLSFDQLFEEVSKHE